MANILSQGAVFLEAQRIKHLSEPVTYRRGNNSVQVDATRGKTNFTVDDEAGFSVGSHVVDFIIAKSQMQFGTDAIIPRLGDTIEAADGTVFEVVYLAPMDAGGSAMDLVYRCGFIQNRCNDVFQQSI